MVAAPRMRGGDRQRLGPASLPTRGLSSSDGCLMLLINL